jgi:hypothetical protein
MKKLFIVFPLFVACSKGNEPLPSKQAVAVKKDSHTLNIQDDNYTSNLYINQVRQAKIKDTSYVVHSGDNIQVVNLGEDSWNTSGTKTDGPMSLKVFIDGEVVYDRMCNCDGNYSTVIK